jgi:putative glycosyltransferase (TIGR04372 family)
MSRTAKKPQRKANRSQTFLQAREAWSAGQLSEAARLLDRMLAANADDADAAHLRGVVALGAGQPQLAVDLLQRAARLSPLNDDFGCDLGTGLHAMQRRDEAARAYRVLLQRNPSHKDALFNLGNVLREQTRFSEALQCFTRLLELAPQHPAWNNLGLTLFDLGHFAEARNCLEQALRMNPRDIAALANLGLLQLETGQLIGARSTLEQALSIAPDHADLHLNLGNVLASLGQTALAIEHLRRAVQLTPGHSAAHSALICALDYDVRASTADQQSARRAWYDVCIRPLGVTPLDHYRAPDPERKLRIAYVSADLRITSAAMAFAPMLCQYDREQFEVFCYSNSDKEDALSAMLRQAVTCFHGVAGASDAELAALIAADRIDILIDLSGHLRGHRLGVFAYRPAPLQGTAWGYANGSGMPEMDFIFADEVFLPADDAQHFSETVLNLSSVIPYHALDELPRVAPLPAMANGAITFGCFSRLQKLTDATVEMFAQVLLAMPTARLCLKAAQSTDADVLEGLLAKFDLYGIERSRLRFVPRGSWLAHMESFREIDIQLDPYPHGGGVSLLDGMVMGVPTLTLKGFTPAARLGAALIEHVGLGAEWIATSPADFSAKAKSACENIAALEELRRILRDRMLQTPIGHTSDYVRQVEEHYRRQWRERCSGLRAERDTRLARVRRLLEQSQGADAIASLQALLSADPCDSVALHYAGLADFQSDRPEQAIDNLRRAVAAAPKYVDAWIDLGIVLTSIERLDEAIDALRSATVIQADHLLAHSNLGIALLKAGLLDDAQRAFEAAQRLDTRDAGVLSNLGIVHERRGKQAEAQNFYRRSVDCNPALALGHYNLGRLALERGDVSAAIAHLERALVLEPRRHNVRYELAHLYERAGLGARIYKLLDYGASSGPHDLAPATAAEAFAWITRQINADPTCAVRAKESLCADLMPLAGRLIELNDPAKIVLLRQMIALNASNLQTYLRLGIAHHHDGHYDLAAIAWQEGLRKRDQLAAAAGLLDHPHRVLDSTWTLAVGHLQLLDPYVKSMLLNIRPSRKLWLLQLPRHAIPNRCYFNYWRAHVNTVEPRAGGDNLLQTADAVGVAPNALPLITDHFFADRVPGAHELWHMQFAAKVQRQWEQQQRAPLLQLTAQDRRFGAGVLEQLGVPAQAWYVCLHVRESGFWWKWDRNHASIRNADIESYQLAIRAIVARGGWVIRMGDNSMRPVPPLPQVIDYALSPHKSERMDVFLSGSCRMFIGVNSGMSLLPPTFGVPCLLTNFVPISIPFPYGADRMLPKRYRSKSDGHVLSFDEMFLCGAAHYYSENHLPDWLEVIDNSEEEIAEGVIEMLDELDGRIGADEAADYVSLRRRYDAIVLAQGGFTGTPLSGRFLRRHQTMLNAECREAAA